MRRQKEGSCNRAASLRLRRLLSTGTTSVIRLHMRDDGDWVIKLTTADVARIPLASAATTTRNA